MFIKAKLLQDSTSNQETSRICSGPVGEAMLDTVAFEFMGIGCTEDLVAGNLGSDNLANNIAIGEADHEAVFRSVVFVLSLGDQTLASIVIGFTSTTTLILGLVPAVV